MTLFGYNIQVRVDHGHLLIDDGIGSARRHYRLPRVGHGLKRLIIIGSDGSISLAAIHWLTDQGVALAMLESEPSTDSFATFAPTTASSRESRHPGNLLSAKFFSRNALRSGWVLKLMYRQSTGCSSVIPGR